VASSQQPARFRRTEPVLITEAQPSLADQHAARKRRYVLTMAVRAVSVVLAAVVYTTTQLLWLVLVLAILGTVLPWFAVLMANDGPPKSRAHVHRPDRTLQNRDRPALEGSRVIEH
jgi:Flp pilus assembly protein TadB